MRLYKFILAALLLSALAGCGGLANGLLNIPNPKVTPINAFDGVPLANFAVGSNMSPSSIAFGTAGNPIITTNGRKDINAGTTTLNDLATLPNQLFEQNVRYIALGYGGLGTRAISFFTVDKSKPSFGNIAFRIINGASTLGNLDVYVTDNAGLGTLPVSPTVANVPVGEASIYQNFPDGGGTITIRVRVYAAGDRTTPLLDKTYTIINQLRVSLVAYDADVATAGLIQLQDTP